MLEYDVEDEFLAFQTHIRPIQESTMEMIVFAL